MAAGWPRQGRVTTRVLTLHRTPLGHRAAGATAQPTEPHLVPEGRVVSAETRDPMALVWPAPGLARGLAGSGGGRTVSPDRSWYREVVCDFLQEARWNTHIEAHTHVRRIIAVYLNSRRGP